jgi:peptidyl-prolyl cis-trans isomerase D
MMVKPFNDYVFNNRVGRIGLVETDFGFHVIKIVAKEDLVKVATLALRNIPSEKTSDSVFNIASKFEIDLSNDMNVYDIASKYKLEVKDLSDIGELDHDLPNLPNQRRLVQWLFDEETEVNDYERFDVSSGGYVLAILTEKKNEGLKSNDQVLLEVLPTLQNQKKADLIIKNNRNIDNLESLADENNTEVLNVDVLNKNTPLVAQAGFEPKIIGTAFSLDLNESSKLIEGETGVYMIRVDKITKAENLPNSFTPYEKQVSSKLRSNIDFNVVQSLKKSSEIVDNRSDYY